MQNPHRFKKLSQDYKDLSEATTNHVQNDLENELSTHLTIQIENRKFCLSLEKLDNVCRRKIAKVFAQKQYSLEELLTMFVTTLRDQSAAEQEIICILQLLESKS